MFHCFGYKNMTQKVTHQVNVSSKFSIKAADECVECYITWVQVWQQIHKHSLVLNLLMVELTQFF